jgi:hypothetical protein
MPILYCLDRGVCPPFWSEEEPQREETITSGDVPFNLEISDEVSPIDTFNKVNSVVNSKSYTKLTRIA